jgi:hypothetical protein
MPPVSTTSIVFPNHSKLPYNRSRVVPATSLTSALFLPQRRLNRLLFPTFGLNTQECDQKGDKQNNPPANNGEKRPSPRSSQRGDAALLTRRPPRHGRRIDTNAHQRALYFIRVFSECFDEKRGMGNKQRWARCLCCIGCQRFFSFFFIRFSSPYCLFLSSLDAEEVKSIADAAEISPKRVKELHKKWLEFAGKV